MKILVLATSVLTVAMMAYAVNVEGLKQLYGNMASCIEELQISMELNTEMMKCLLIKDGLVDEQQGMINEYGILNNIALYITDPYRLHQAQSIVSSCIHSASQIADYEERLNTAITCIQSAYTLVDL